MPSGRCWGWKAFLRNSREEREEGLLRKTGLRPEVWDKDFRGAAWFIVKVWVYAGVVRVPSWLKSTFISRSPFSSSNS